MNQKIDWRSHHSIFAFLFLLLFFSPSLLLCAEKLNFTEFKKIPTLDDGRIKPLDTFARESVQTITGSRTFKGEEPIGTLLGWLANPQEARNRPILLARYEPLNRKLHLKTEDKRVSAEQLMQSKELQNFLQEISIKQQAKENLNSLEKEALQLFERWELLQRILSGSAFVVFPPQVKGGKWIALDSTLSAENFNRFRTVVDAFERKDAVLFDKAVTALKQSLRAQGEQSGFYPSESEMIREAHYNQLRPFQKAWIVFLLTFLICWVSFLGKGKILYWTSFGVASLGVGFSVYGFVLRSLISGRAPVTNMYESVIWVSFGAMLFALLFELIYRSRYFLLCTSLAASIGLILADNLPGILKPEIDPLVPVLRSNFWLTIHVLTITLSYAAFLVAMAVGQVTLGYYAFSPSSREKVKSLNLFLYRAMQVGVVLLAAGTLLGGVWAAYSWGRFWGWDPKEVWALIALLGYLAILHGRFSGWIKEFGIAAWSVLSFLLILMAWYGVNFILGVGLHSYGFSTGGFRGVIVFVSLQLAWVIFATYRYKRNFS